MLPIGRRPTWRRRAALTIGLVGGLGILAASQLSVSAVTIPSGFFVVNDLAGANDVPGQVDLTRMGRDDSDATKYKIFMSWDSVDQWTGTGQTGDACALFDTNGNGTIDFVVCGQVHNRNADPTFVEQTATSPFAFSCTDKKTDRCSNPSPVGYTFGTQVVSGPIGSPSVANRFANLISDTDPFNSSAVNGPGTSYPNDSTLEIDILKTFIPGTEVLVNVCSYPSAGNGGNNNPFDCITTPGTGFLKIVKQVSGGSTQQFDFAVSPAPPSPQPSTYSLTPTSGSAETSPISAVITTSESVTETIPSGWNLSASSNCTVEGISGTTGSVNTTSGAITGIAIASGKVTTCTFINTPVQPKLTVTKTVINDSGGTKKATDFSFTVDGGSATAFIQDGADPLKGKNTLNLTTGSHTLAELDVAGYTEGSWGGACAADGSITLALGDDKTCTITNNDDQGSLTLVKRVQSDNGGTATLASFSLATNAGSLTFDSGVADGTNITKYTSTAIPVNAGEYTMSEANVAGYAEGSWSCPLGTGVTSTFSAGKVTVPNGVAVVCTITNNDDKAQPGGSTAQTYVFFDSLTMTGLRTGAATPGTLTFKLWATKTDTVCSDQVGSDVTVSNITANIKYTMATGISVTDDDTYYWTVEYSGDAFNEGFTTACGSETTTISKTQ